MPTLICTNCGAAGSSADAFCTRCGMPRAGGPAPQGRGGSGARVGMWVAILAACGFGGIVVIGILAAIAIPRFSSMSSRAKEGEAVPILRQLHALETSHHQRHGRFTANLDQPDARDHLEAWSDPGARYFTFSVSRATEDELCIEATPSELGRGEGVRPSSMDAAGTRYAGPGCAEEAAETASWESTGEALASDSEARPVLQYLLLAETRFREQNGRFTADLDGLKDAGELDNQFFTFAVSQATEDRLCVEARPTQMGRAAGVAESSMDREGTHYLGLGCKGTVMHRAPRLTPKERAAKQKSPGKG